MYIIITFKNTNKCSDTIVKLGNLQEMSYLYRGLIDLNLDDPVMQIIISNNNNKCDDGFYYVSDQYDLFDPKIIKKFNLPITTEYISLLNKYNKTNVLDHLIKNLHNYPNSHLD